MREFIISLLTGLGLVLAALGFIIFGALIMAFPVMWAWNYVVPDLFGMMVLEYWQAFCLYILSGLLIKTTDHRT